MCVNKSVKKASIVKCVWDMLAYAILSRFPDCRTSET